MEYILIIIVIVAIFVILQLKNLRSKNPARSVSDTNLEKMPYKSKYILTKNEYVFYNALRPLTDNRNYLICPKVGLKDIASITDKQNYMKWFGKISQKHVDFIVCDNTLKPLFAIELDDSSHDNEKAVKNDTFKDEFFTTINLDLVRVRNTDIPNLENKLFSNF